MLRTLPQIDALVHQFKGSSASFGAHTMAGLCVQVGPCSLLARRAWEAAAWWLVTRLQSPIAAVLSGQSRFPPCTAVCKLGSHHARCPPHPALVAAARRMSRAQPGSLPAAGGAAARELWRAQGAPGAVHAAGAAAQAAGRQLGCSMAAANRQLAAARSRPLLESMNGWLHQPCRWHKQPAAS